MSNPIRLNARDLEKELNWVTQVLDNSLKLYFGQETEHESVYDVKPPRLSRSRSTYATILRKYRMSFAERFTLILSLVPHIRPQMLDVFLIKNQSTDQRFTEFGGLPGQSAGGFLPTLETLLFILAGPDLELRFKLMALFEKDHFFSTDHILDIQTREGAGADLKSPLKLTPEFISLLTRGNTQKPEFSTQFPARHIDTSLEWQDLVLNPATLSQLKGIESWIRHKETLLNDWQLKGKIHPGYRALFHGPPGTGKTLAATLVGKSTGLPVYHIDLSAVVSKYIGETEKNVSKVFDKATNQGSILFFDEADALFGKRTEVKDSHDRYANQEVSYLLQRLESFDGIAILAIHQKENIDDAFIRRFQSIIHFPLPDAKQRLQLWQNGLPPKAKLAPDVDLATLAQKYELPGGAIMNVIRFASLNALERGDSVITLSAIQQGIRREYMKEGKTL